MCTEVPLVSTMKIDKMGKKDDMYCRNPIIQKRLGKLTSFVYISLSFINDINVYRY